VLLQLFRAALRRLAAFERDEDGDGLALELVGRPTAAASATLGWLTRALSTSIVLRRWPETLITSSMRP
jgi:hypothetical protein